MGENPPRGCTDLTDMLNYPWIFNAFATTSSTLFTTSLTPPAAAILIIHQIITLTSDQSASFITSLPLRLLGLALIPHSTITLGSHSH